MLAAPCHTLCIYVWVNRQQPIFFESHLPPTTCPRLTQATLDMAPSVHPTELLPKLFSPHPLTWRLSTEKATDSTSLVWPTKRRVVAPVFRSHRRRVPSLQGRGRGGRKVRRTTPRVLPPACQAVISMGIPISVRQRQCG